MVIKIEGKSLFVNRKGVAYKFAIFFAFLLLILAFYFASAESVVTPISFNINEDSSNLFNISINNSNLELNITQINITLPSGFIYLLDSANSSIWEVSQFSLEGLVLNWENTSSYIINASSFEYFWFNATSDNPGNYNLSVITTYQDGSTNFSNISVIVNDTSAPQVSFVSPINYGNYSTFIILNASISDYSSIDSVYFNITNSSGQVEYVKASQTGNYWNYTLNISNYPEILYNITVYANDSLGYINNTSSVLNILLDNTFPLIDFSEGSEVNGYNTTRNWIYVNVSVIELNEKNISFNLYNSSSLVNLTTYTNSNREINWTGLVDGTYYYNITIYDFAGNKNSTPTRIFNIDSIAPNINIYSPLNTSYNNRTILVNLSSSEVGSVWFYNGTGNESYSTEVYREFSEGSNVFYVWANDSLGNINSTTVLFYIDSISPNVSIITPINNQNYSQTILLNVSIIDNSSISSVRFNITNNSGQAAYLVPSQNGNYWNYSLNISSYSNGLYNLSIYANDSLNNINNSQIVSFNVSNYIPDTIYPIFYNYYSNNGTLNNSGIAQFNVSVNNTNGSVIFTFNGTNYFATNFSENMYNVSISISGNGTYIYNWSAYGNGTENNINLSNNFIYVVNYLDVVSPYFTYIPSNITNEYNPSLSIGVDFNATDSDSFSTFYISNWTTHFSINSSGYLNNSLPLGVGIYVINVSINDSTGNINYTLFEVNITRNNTFGLSMNFAPSSSISYGTQTNVTGADCPLELVCNLYQNNISISNSINQTLGVGIYVYDYNTSGNLNYSNKNVSAILNVNIASQSITPRLNDLNQNLTITYPNTLNVSYSGTNYTYLNISINGVELSIGTNYLYGAGSYIVNYSLEGNENYSAYENYLNVTINQATGLINASINYSSSNFSTYNDSSSLNILLNLTNVAGEGIGRIYVNGSLINSGTLPLVNITNFSLGYYNVTFEYDGNQNYTSDLKVIWVNISVVPEDTIYPIFYNYSDNSFGLNGSGIARFFVNINNTNGTVYLQINNTNYTATNITNNYNVSVFLTNGTYNYQWTSYGNGSGNNFNISSIQTYTLNNSFVDLDYPIFYNEINNNGTLNNSGIGLFNITINNTNGTVILNINGQNIIATNLTSNVYNVSYNFITNGSYSYNWSAYGNGSWNNINYSNNFVYVVNYVDEIYPIFYNLLDNNNSFVNSGLAIFNVTINNTNGTVIFELDGVNYTANNVSSNVYNYSSILTNGSYNYRWMSYGNGSENNYNSSSIFNYVINYSDLFAPNISIHSPLNQTYNSNSILFNVTINETGSCIYSLDVSQNNISMSSEDNLTYYSLNSSMNQGGQQVTFFCNDSSGNINSSTIYFYLDSVAPNINYSSETAYSGFVSNFSNFTYINVSINLSEIKNISFVLYRNTSELINITVYNNSSSEVNFTNLIEGNYTYYVYVYDMLSNLNRTSNRTKIYDITAPNLSASFSTTSSSISASVSAFGELSGLNSSSCRINEGNIGSLTLSSLSASTLYNINISCFDYAGNFGEVSYNVSTIAESVDNGGSGGGGGGGGGGSASSIKTYTVLNDEIVLGITKNLSKGDKIKFNISNESHQIKILNISNKSLFIEISSNPFNVSLNYNESKEIDVNSDKINDIVLRAVYLSNLNVFLYISKIMLLNNSLNISENLIINESEINETETSNETIIDSSNENPSQEWREREKVVLSFVENLFMIIASILALIIVILSLINYFYQRKIDKSSVEKEQGFLHKDSDNSEIPNIWDIVK